MKIGSKKSQVESHESKVAGRKFFNLNLFTFHFSLFTFKILCTLFPIAIGIVLCTSFSYAQQKLPQVAIDREIIKIGEQISVTLVLEGLSSDGVIWPTFTDTLGNGFELVQANKIDTSYQEDVKYRTLQQKLIITHFDSGHFWLKPFIFTIGKNTVLKTDSFLLHVQTIQVDTTQAFQDIKGPYSVPFTLQDWLLENWKYLVGAQVILILIGIGLILYFRYLKKKKMIPLTPVKEIKSPKTIAIEKLDELKTKKLWQSGKYKEYHSLISTIVRQYIENQLNIPALEQTTYEILLSLRGAAISEESKAKLKQLLILSDLAKFAKEEPIEAENTLSIKNAYDFINETSNTQQPELNS